MGFSFNMISSLRNNRNLRKRPDFDPYKNKDEEIKAKGELNMKPISPDQRSAIKAKAQQDDFRRRRKSFIVLIAVSLIVLWFLWSYVL